MGRERQLVEHLGMLEYTFESSVDISPVDSLWDMMVVDTVSGIGTGIHCHLAVGAVWGSLLY